MIAGIRELLVELWGARALVGALVERHLALRYRGSFLGFAWSILNPLFLVLVYTLVFKYFIRFDVPNYSLFVLTGLLPWVWSSASLIEGTTSVVSSAHLITKSMFPPQVLPLVAVITNAVNLALSLPIVFIAMVVIVGTVPWTGLLVVPLVAIHAVLLYGATLLLASCNVKYRDVQHLLGNVLTLLFFVTPIVFPASAVPASFSWLLRVSPFAALTAAYHDVLLHGVVPSLMTWGVLVAWSAGVFVVGATVFLRLRERFAEAL